MTTQQIASRYNVLKTLGEGGMGLVSLVEDTTSGQQVALKVLSGAIGATEETILQFKQEFRLMTQLNHPNCCAVYDYGLLPEGAPYFTMEVVPGAGLDEMLPLSAEHFRGVFSQLLMALGYVHQQGFVHCDIKSENVRVRPDGAVKLMDFGLMERAGRSGGPIKGTLAYIAPEMAKGGRIDQRADLYSLGALAYELLTGHVPFTGATPAELIKAHLNDLPVPPSKLKGDVDPEYERIILKLLSKEPLARYQSAFDVMEDLGIEVPEGMGGNLLTSPFVGRADELAVLTCQLRSLVAGKAGKSLLLSGAAGLGKSRLAEEFRFLVQMENLPYAVGASFEQGTAPYGAFVEALRGLLPAFKEHAPEALAKYGPVLVKLLPEIGVEPAPELEPKNEKLRLQATVTEALAALAAKKGFVVVLEDWHWADALSSELLVYVLRNTKGWPITFLLNFRGTPEGEPAWAEHVEPLPLPVLSTDELTRMVTSMLGTEEVGSAFLAKVVEFSEGNPFFVEGLLEHLVRNRTLVKTKGKWNADVELTPDQMPANLQNLLLEKLDALSELGMAIARIGAVVGRELGLDLLQKVASLPEERLFDALGELAEQGIFTQGESGAYRFTQGQLQEVLYASLPVPEQTRLHTAIAEALESQLPDLPLAELPMEAVSAIANHYLRSDVADKTIIYALEAGMRSANLFANADAERFLNSGLALITEEAGDRWVRARLDYLRTLGDVRRVSGNSGAAQDVFTEAIAIAEALGEQRLLGTMLTSLGKVHQMLNQYDEALKHTERSVAVCEANGDKAGAARCLLTTCRILFFTGKVPEALETTERALVLAREAEEKLYIGEALAFLGMVYISSDPDKIQQGIDNLNESIAILTELGDKIRINNSLNLMGNAQNMLGDFQGAWTTFTQNQKICFEIGMKDEEVFALLNLALTGFELGNHQEAVRMARETNALARKINSKLPLGMALVLEAVAGAYAGQLSGAKRLAREAVELAQEIKSKYLESLVIQYQVEVLLFLGELDEAAAAADALTALIKETGNTEPEHRLGALLGEVLGHQGELDRALAVVEHALNGAVTGGAKGIEVRARRAKAWLSLKAGRLDEARTLAGEALALSQRIGSKLQAALAQGLLGEIALASGTGDALKHFTSMQTTAEALGSSWLKALALFGQAAANPHVRSAKAFVTQSQKLLTAFIEPLDAEGRARFLALPERARLIAGDFAAVAGDVPQPMTGGSIADRLQRIGRELADVGAQYTAREAEIKQLEEDKVRLEKVAEFSQLVNQIRDPLAAIDTSLDRIMEHVHAERGYMVLDGAVKGQAMRQIRPDGGYQADWAFASSLAAKARETGFGQLVSQAQDDPDVASALQESGLQIRTALSVPLKHRGNVVGELYLDRESDDGVYFLDEDLGFVSALVNQAVTAIQNASLFAEWTMRSRQLEMLNTLAEKINETLVVEEVLDLVVKLTLEVTRAERAFLMLRAETEEGSVLQCKAAFDQEGRQLLNERISMSICNKVLTTGQAVTVVDATEDEEFQFQKSIMSLNLRTLMCVPLMAKGKSLGVLYVDSQAVVTTFTERDLDLLKAIAGHSSGAIENATLYSTLNERALEQERLLEMYRKAEYEASTDMLTGLNNRRFFQEQSTREMDVSKRHHRHMSIIILDVDHFKRFNDTYGHAIGDEVLKIMGRVLTDCVRLSDLPARFGGEEFVVLCPDTDENGASIVAERIRKAVMAVQLTDLDGNPVRQITASLGVASLKPMDQTVAEIIERADVALYACKHAGRNQVQIYHDGMISEEDEKRKVKERQEKEAERDARVKAEKAADAEAKA